LREACGVTRKFGRCAFTALVLAFVGWINVAKFKLDIGLHDELLPKIHMALVFVRCFLLPDSAANSTRLDKALS
jgi:hypothetical protein